MRRLHGLRPPNSSRLRSSVLLGSRFWFWFSALGSAVPQFRSSALGSRFSALGSARFRSSQFRSSSARLSVLGSRLGSALGSALALGSRFSVLGSAPQFCASRLSVLALVLGSRLSVPQFRSSAVPRSALVLGSRLGSAVPRLSVLGSRFSVLGPGSAVPQFSVLGSRFSALVPQFCAQETSRWVMGRAGAHTRRRTDARCRGGRAGAPGPRSAYADATGERQLRAARPAWHRARPRPTARRALPRRGAVRRICRGARAAQPRPAPRAAAECADAAWRAARTAEHPAGRRAAEALGAAPGWLAQARRRAENDLSIFRSSAARRLCRMPSAFAAQPRRRRDAALGRMYRIKPARAGIPR